MIPKIIHYCWLSGEKFPEDIARNLETWKNLLPDYKFILWDTQKIDLSINKFAKQAFEKKKYAFAADFVRMYALHEYGGIYLDLDVQVLKPFDSLLHLPYFIGEEYPNDSQVIIEAAIIGAEKKSDWISDCLRYYSGKSFLLPNGNYDLTVLPTVIKKSLMDSRSIKVMDENEIENIETIINQRNILYLFPYEYFSPKDFRAGKFYISKKTYTIHHFNSSWLPKFSRMRRKIKNIVGNDTIDKLIHKLRLDPLMSFLRKVESLWDRKT